MSAPPRGRAYNPLLRSYPRSVKINACGLLAEVVYVRLIAMADDAGRYWAGPRRLLGLLLTERWERGEVDEAAVERALDELAAVGLIVRYEAEGLPYLELCRLFRALKNDRPARIEFPTPPGSAPDPTPEISGTAAAAAAADPTEPQPSSSSNGTGSAAAAAGGAFAGDVAAAVVAAGACPGPVSAAWVKAEKFLGRQNGAALDPSMAKLRNWLFVKGDRAESALDALIRWARTKKSPAGALMSAIEKGYADDHAR